MIRILPPEVVNQIAAGEVVERPYSVVKELLENCLDAGARRIVVEIEEGGRKLVRVTDDGCGFSAEDLALAFAAHATSKLAAATDLDHIASLGFRGEALASIGSVSRASIQSRPPDEESGHQVAVEGGTMTAVRPCGCPPGTVVEIRDLFFNVPARRRFLKTPQAERSRIVERMRQLSVPRPDVDFTLISAGKEILRLPAGESLVQRIRRAYGRKLTGDLLPVALQAGDVRIGGFIGDPDGARRDGSLELLFVNGRCAMHRSAMHAVRQAYREYLIHGRIPVTFLMLELPPDQVDVNVHPTKAEVRFLDKRLVCGLLHEAVQQALLGRSVVARQGRAVGQGLPPARSGFPDLAADLFGRGAAPEPVREAPVGKYRAEPAPARSHPFRRVSGRFLQVMNLYLLFEGEDGLVMVDQHALHERVLYEKFKKRHAQRGTPVQRLLAPDVVELMPADKEWILQWRDVLGQEGLLVEDFGGDVVAVHGVPAVLGGVAGGKLLEALLGGEGCGGRRESGRPSAADAVVERFHSMACRAAVMAGDKLSDEEIAQLLADAAELEHPHNCPHGRPTVMTFGKGDLERYFQRVV